MWTAERCLLGPRWAAAVTAIQSVALHWGVQVTRRTFFVTTEVTTMTDIGGVEVTGRTFVSTEVTTMKETKKSRSFLTGSNAATLPTELHNAQLDQQYQTSDSCRRWRLLVCQHIV